MGYLIIGSTALQEYIDIDREPKDLDVLATPTSEYLIDVPADVYSHPLLDTYLEYRASFATLDELYTIKVSHSHWDLKNGSWGKHMADILKMQAAGAKLMPDFYQLLYKVWLEKHGPKKMTFSESEEFFDDAVVRKYDHDSLHESVAYGDHAMYIDYLMPGRSVAMDMAKVWATPHDDLVKLFREEIYATALERWVVPREYRISPGWAYHWALRRTITSLTKGKSSLWLIENFKDFKSANDPYTEEGYVERHHRKAHKLIRLVGVS